MVPAAAVPQPLCSKRRTRRACWRMRRAGRRRNSRRRYARCSCYQELL
jgi:hypothetical protein